MTFASRARFYDPGADEVLHHDLFVDLLHGAITRDGGTYRAVALRTGLSERYLYFVRRKQRPVPTPEMLEHILSALRGVSPREAAALRESARRTRPSRRPLGNSVRQVLGDDEVAAEVDRLLRRHHLALHGASAEEAARAYQEMHAGVTRLLGRVRDLFADPTASVRLHLLRCNIASVLDDAPSALESARIAQLVLDEHAARTGDTAPVLTALRVESLRAEAMALHNLNQDGAALERYRQAEPLLMASRADPERAYVALGRISALVGTRRFRIGDVLALVDAIRRECDRGAFADRERDLVLLRTDRGLAEAYARHRDRRPRTERLLRDQVDRVERTAWAGPLHRVQIYGTFAAYCLARGDRQGRAEMLGRAVRTAEAAGLDHQRRRLEREIERSG